MYTVYYIGITFHYIVSLLYCLRCLYYFTHKTLEQVENKIGNDGNGEIGPFRRHLDMGFVESP